MKVEEKNQISYTAVQVMKEEADAIYRAAERVNESFDACVRAIYNASGRLVVTGVGKSAIIANKIVATLNSTGTPALFMHAADAVHGDLGMVQSEDIVMCISKSGNTPEVKALVPMLKRRGVKLIALVSNTDSFLAHQSDFVIDGTIESEACPNNLAPTTSTTVHLALGGAIAVSLLKLRNFSREDFARYHPGGSLGKQLYLKVSDVVTAKPPLVDVTAGMREVIVEISSKRQGATIVLRDGALAGIITDGDIRRMLQRTEDFRGLSAGDIMGLNPKTVNKDDYATAALQIMQENKISQLVVLDQHLVYGIIHLHDLLKEGIV